MDAAERSHAGVRAPSALLLAAEQRAVLELGAFVAASPLLRMAGRGDRHPVLVLPGFTGALDLTLTTPAADVAFSTADVMTIITAGLVLG